MKRLLLAGLISALLFSGSIASANNYKYEAVGVPVKVPTGHTVTVNSLVLTENADSMQLTVDYTQTNESGSKRINVDGFDLFFLDGTMMTQSGFGNETLAPGESRALQWSFVFSKLQKPFLIEWGAAYLPVKRPSSLNKWNVESLSVTPNPVPSPTSTQSPSKSLYQNFGSDVLTSSGLKIKATYITFEPNFKGEPEVIFTFDLSTSIKTKKVSTGTFSLHFESGSPLLMKVRSWPFTLRANSNYPIGHRWKLKPTQLPLYVQWNPSNKVLSPKVKALRWEVPRG